MNDADEALRREIEDAFDVEPSPAFVTRVLANKPARRTWRFGWTFVVSVSAVAAAIAAAVLVMPGRGARTPAPAAKPVVATLPPVSAPAPVVARAQPKEPEVLFAKDETAALQRLTRGITRGAVDPETLSQPGTTTIAAIQSGPIVLAPLAEMSLITLEPLGSLVEGARQ